MDVVWVGLGTSLKSLGSAELGRWVCSSYPRSEMSVIRDLREQIASRMDHMAPQDRPCRGYDGRFQDGSDLRTARRGGRSVRVGGGGTYVRRRR